jgi:hypothetical protein
VNFAKSRKKWEAIVEAALSTDLADAGLGPVKDRPPCLGARRMPHRLDQPLGDLVAGHVGDHGCEGLCGL